jgi:predicted polyphosphate/ATP-dependent NAD kinase
MDVKKLGVIVNPIAGLGGRVGLKGTDGLKVLRMARNLGAEPESPKRTVEALKIVSGIKDRIDVITYPHEMGEEECREARLRPRVIGSIKKGETTSNDTKRAAQEMVAAGVSLLLFAGGDGTARNIYDAVRHKVPALGIPTGVKIHSAVFAVTPRSAGHVAVMFLEGLLTKNRVAEVMDIDEEAFRHGQVIAKLYGTLRVPEENRYIQSPKSGGIHSEKEALQGIAASVIDAMHDPECCFIIGSGTTTRSIMVQLGLENTLLGVDVVCNKRLVANDVTERQLLDLTKDQRAKIVVTVIGGQGHIFGRGNQQISPRVIRQVGRENIIVVATKEKLALLKGRPLLVDTGEEELDEELSGYLKVTTGYQDYVMYRVGYEPQPLRTGSGA